MRASGEPKHRRLAVYRGSFGCRPEEVKELTIQKLVNKNQRDYLVLFLLTLFSLLARWYLISYYPVPVFDEVSYVPSGGELISQNVIAPAHPPLGLFLISLGGRIGGASSFGWRFFPVLLGSACIPLLFLVGRRLWPGSDIPLYAAAILAFDPMLFVFSRLALLDVFMCFFILLSAYFLVSGRKILCAVSLGCALCTKWVSLAVLCAFIFIVLRDFFKGGLNKNELLQYLSVFLVLAPFSYGVLCAALYGSLNPAYIAQIHRHLLSHIALIPASAYLGTPWWSWLLIPQCLPLGEKQIASAAGSVTLVMKIVEIPLLLWTGILAVIDSIGEVLGKGEKSPLEIPLILFCILFFPWALSPRGTYFFYLLPALPFLYLMTAHFLNKYLQGSFNVIRIIFIVYMVFAFLMLYPHLVGWLS